MKITVPRKLKDGRLVKDLTLEEVQKMCTDNTGCEGCEFLDTEKRICLLAKHSLIPLLDTAIPATWAESAFNKIIDKPIEDFTLKEISQMCKQNSDRGDCRQCEFYEHYCEDGYLCKFSSRFRRPSRWQEDIFQVDKSE